MSDDVDKLPTIYYYDIVNYVVNMKSSYTMKELCLKSMVHTTFKQICTNSSSE